MPTRGSMPVKVARFAIRRRQPALRPAVRETATDAGTQLSHYDENDSCAKPASDRLQETHALAAVHVAKNEVGSLGCDIAFARAAT